MSRSARPEPSRNADDDQTAITLSTLLDGLAAVSAQDRTDLVAAACRLLNDRGCPDETLSSLVRADEPRERAVAARTFATGVTSQGPRPQARRAVIDALDDDTPVVRRAAVDAVVSLAQTDPARFDAPETVATKLRRIATEQSFDRLSRGAIDEAIDALSPARLR